MDTAYLILLAVIAVVALIGTRLFHRPFAAFACATAIGPLWLFVDLGRHQTGQGGAPMTEIAFLFVTFFSAVASAVGVALGGGISSPKERDAK